MKLAKLNLDKDNSLFDGVEPDGHYQNRIHKIVSDDYDFNHDGDTDVSGDPTAWDTHANRLQINFMHSYKKIYVILLAAANPNYPTLDWSGISALPDAWNELGVRMHVYPNSSDRIGVEAYQVEDEHEDLENYASFLEDTRNGRVAIYEQMRIKAGEHMVLGNISLEQSQQMMADIHPIDFFYIQTNNPQFKAWIESTSVTIDGTVYDYTTTGFESKSYFNEDIKHDILDVYNGTHYANDDH